MKSRPPSDAEYNRVRSVIDPLVSDRHNAHRIAAFALAEKFALIADDFSLAHFFHYAKQEGGDVNKMLRNAQIATGQAGNPVASTAGVEALNAARAKLDVMFAEPVK